MRENDGDKMVVAEKQTTAQKTPIYIAFGHLFGWHRLHDGDDELDVLY